MEELTSVYETDEEVRIKAAQTVIEKLLMDTNRPGMGELIRWMKNNNFFYAPCSGGNHLSVVGGLAQHSLNVCDQAMALAKMWEPTIDMDSIIIAALLHDLGKTGDHDKAYYVTNILKNGNKSASKPFKSNPELLSLPHEVRSVIIAERFIHLTEEEEFAITFHNGLYTHIGYEAKGKERPLQLIIHFADMWCCRVIEGQEGDSEE